MQKDQAAGNSMLKSGLAECPNSRTNWLVCVQRNKRRPVRWAAMAGGRIVGRSHRCRVTRWLYVQTSRHSFE